MEIGSSPPKKNHLLPRLTGRARPAGAVCGIPTRRLSETCAPGKLRRCHDIPVPTFLFRGKKWLYIYTVCIYIYLLYIIYIYRFQRGVYIYNYMIIIVQSNNFPQLSNIKRCVVRHLFHRRRRSSRLRDLAVGWRWWRGSDLVGPLKQHPAGWFMGYTPEN